MNNIITNIPNRGDIAVGNLLTKKVEFIKFATFVLSELDTSRYEIEGVVVKRNGKKVLIAHNTRRDSKTWCSRYQWKLTGYTTDGTDRTGVISIRDNSSASANTDYTVSYNASTYAELVAQLNTFFADTTNPVFQTQDWYAFLEEDGIKLQCNYTFWQQDSYNTGKTGFTFTKNTMADVDALANMRRNHGGAGGEGSISNMARAISYFRADISSSTYNPTSVLTSIKTTYPVCLPAYLGTSQHRQTDCCAILRNTYGQGEAGWLKYLESCRPVVPTDYGNMGIRNGLELTNILAAKTYTSSTKTNEPMCLAAKYCADTETQCLPKGKWHLPTPEEVYHILDGVEYGTNNSRNADILNAALYKAGGNAINNGSGLWSCSRSYSSIAWHAYGSIGFFYRYYFCYTYSCVPVSLYKIA